MAKDKITEYDATAANNTDVGGVNLGENSMNPSDVNNAIREVLSHQKEAFGSGTPLFVDQTNNRVGVNKTPTVALDVSGQAIITTADNSVNLNLVSTDADANSAPELELYRNSASPADNDFVGTISFKAENDAGEKIEYGVFNTRIVDASDGTEDFRMEFQGKVGGSDVSLLKMDNSNIVFNEDGVDVDFRVESDNLTDAFFINGANGNVGIGTDSPDTTLDIEATGDCTLTITAGSTSHDSKIEFAHGTTVDGGIQFNHDGSFGSEYIDFRVGNNTNHMRIHGGGAISIGDAKNVFDANATLNVDQKGGGFPVLCHRNGSGDGVQISFHNDNGQVGRINTNGSATSYVTSSDYRLKENVNYNFDATSRLKKLKPSRFNFIADADTTVDGFLAHEVSSIVPEAITGTHNEVEVWKKGEELPDGVSVGDNKLDEDGNTIPIYQGIDQSKLVPLLVKTIQELEARITALESA